MYATPSERVSAAIADRMARASVTQRSLSIATGIPESALSRKLAGERQFNLAEVFRISAFLKVDAAEFLRDAA